MNIQTATRKILDFLKINVVDPINSRYSVWIYDDDTRIDLDKGGFPKILLKKEQSNKELIGIGSTNNINTDRLNSQIKCKVGQHYGVGEEKYTAQEFCGFIANQIEDQLKSNHSTFIDEGFLSVLTILDEFTQDKDKNPIFNLTIEMQYLSQA